MASAEVGTAHVTIYPQTEKGFSNKVGQGIGDGIGNGLSSKAVAIGNIMSGALMKAADFAASGIQQVIGGAFENFSAYEQLTGGVETLFKESAGTVERYAKNAYQTAGMSANQYMETVTGFSASLLQSLGGDTEAAAQYADMAVTDMSDNANKMGSDITSIQNAYQGFAKQNYTMLDNLKLGYGGTKTEMERLLADASKIAGVEFSIESYSDVIQAIHTMQAEMDISGLSVDALRQRLDDASLSSEELQKVADDMGISYEDAAQRMADRTLTAKDAQVLLGTTAKEAATTIEGSANAMKASWDNWLTSLGAADMDVQETTAQLVESVKTYLENAIPALGQIFLSIGEVVKEGLGQVIGEDNAEALFQGISDAATFLADAFSPVAEAIGQIAEGVGPRLQEFCTAIQPLLSGVGSVVGGVLTVAFEGLATVITVVGDALGYIWDNIFKPFIDWVSSTFGPVLEGIGGFLGGIGDAVGGAVDAMSGGMSYSERMTQSMAGDWQAAAIQATNSANTMQTNVSASMQGAANAATSSAQQINQAMDLQPAAEQMSASAEEAAAGIQEPIDAASAEVQEAPTAMISAFNGLGSQLTSAFGTIHFPTAHISYQTVEAGDKTVRVPNIQWYATGGFVDGATLIGAGERGTEMILPERGGLMDRFASALSERIGAAQSIVVNLQYDAGEDASTLATDLAHILGRKLAMEA